MSITTINKGQMKYKTQLNYTMKNIIYIFPLPIFFLLCLFFLLCVVFLVIRKAIRPSPLAQQPNARFGSLCILLFKKALFSAIIFRSVGPQRRVQTNKNFQTSGNIISENDIRMRVGWTSQQQPWFTWMMGKKKKTEETENQGEKERERDRMIRRKKDRHQHSILNVKICELWKTEKLFSVDNYYCQPASDW